MRFYHIVFCNLYLSIVKVNNDGTPVSSAILVFSFIQFVNFFILVILCELLFSLNIYDDFFKPNKTLSGLGSYLLLVALNFMYLYKKNRHQIIIGKYEKLADPLRRRFGFMTIAYCIGSILLLFTLAYIRKNL